MSYVPGYCDSCKKISESPIILRPHGQGTDSGLFLRRNGVLTLREGNLVIGSLHSLDASAIEYPCPFCNEMAEVLRGDHSILGGVYSFLAAQDLDTQRKYKEMLALVQSQDLDEANLQNWLRQNLPDLVPYLPKNLQEWASTIASIIVITNFLIGERPSTSHQAPPQTTVHNTFVENDNSIHIQTTIVLPEAPVPKDEGENPESDPEKNDD